MKQNREPTNKPSHTWGFGQVWKDHSIEKGQTLQ